MNQDNTESAEDKRNIAQAIEGFKSLHEDDRSSVEMMQQWMKEPEQYRSFICREYNKMYEENEQLKKEHKIYQEALESIADFSLMDVIDMRELAIKTLSQLEDE